MRTADLLPLVTGCQCDEVANEASSPLVERAGVRGTSAAFGPRLAHIALLAFVAALFLPASAFAQAAVPARVVRSVTIQDSAEAGTAVDGTEGATAVEASTEAKPAGDSAEKPEEESQRLQKLKTLEYDRRASTILETWTKLNAPEEEKDESGEEKSDEEKTEELAKEKTPEELKAEEEAKRKAEEAKQLAAELEELQRDVTLGQWGDVKTYFAGIPEDEGKAGYARMVQSLGTAKMPEGLDSRIAQMQIPGLGKVIEENVFTLEDVVALIDACPHERDEKLFKTYVPILTLAMQRGVMQDDLLELLTAQADDDESVLSRRECAWLLRDSGRIAKLEPFLPQYDDAVKEKDIESLILLAQVRLAEYGEERQTEKLERAWEILQTACFLEGVDDAEKRKDALRRMLALVPRVRDDLGIAWLERTFKDDPEFSVRILASVGTSASTALQSNPTSPSSRLENLKVQKTVIESLLEKSPERAETWRDTLRMLAGAWVREAEFSRQRDSSSSRGPRMRRDPFGNLYYVDDGSSMMYGGGGGDQPIPIASTELIEVAPSEAWTGWLDEETQPKVAALNAQLRLKVGEEDEAFPYIEQLAPNYPDLARGLVHEFLRAWTRNHDPNSSQSYTDSYMWFYGFEQRAAGIPLTRSKQERNLGELTKWVERIRGLGLEDVDESLVAGAFTTCHSSAEVYTLEDIEEVFGSIGDLDAKTLAQLVEQMRGNLNGEWRMPATQENAKTQRKKKDIEAEVVRGYRVALAVCENGLERHEGDWRLRMAKASLMLDEAAFRRDIEPNSEFSEDRLAALAEFRGAAESYTAAVPELKKEEQSAESFLRWFYAGLGASDANRIDHETTPDPKQPPLIRAALEALPGEAAETHRDMFANSLFTRMSSLSPAVKFRYLEAGFEIVGDHEKAHEARDVYEYYRDLVTEIELVARIDGSPRVGHAEPFGVLVEIHHTREIERESGGFAKYLQNQQNAMYGYNYGRPLQNYRDKFEEGVRASLAEHFDVRSVTFYDAKEIRSLTGDEYGWRNTPYAYVLVQPRGPEVDKLPAMKIDLDFLDTSGYVVLPITSAPVPLDAGTESPDPRPYGELQITQILDEREADDDRLRLEVKATGRGLVPALEDLLDVRSSDFEVAEIEDEGVLVSRFDTEAGGPSILSERTWTIEYTGRDDLAALPTEFAFPEPKVEVKQVEYTRYEDADLADVEPVVNLEREYGRVRSPWPWIATAAALLALGGAFVWLSLRNRGPIEEGPAVELPEPLTPFNVLALLRGIERANGFDPETRQQLASSIATLERHHFAADGNGDPGPDLRQVALQWVTRSRSTAPQTS